MIPTKNLTPRQIQRQVDAIERIRVERLGRTVTEAAAELGISRQAVHKAIKRGDLQAHTASTWDGHPLMQFITPEQLEAFKAKRENRAG